ncbi:P-loop containing nucleoside triphosphate hydrolase protein, partial [Phlyctochytrium arcticum]
MNTSGSSTSASSTAKSRAGRGPWQGHYDPTIEASDTFQYILPPPPAPFGQGPTSPVDSSASSASTNSEHETLFTQEELWQQRRGQRIVLTLSDVGGHPFYGSLWPSAIAAADAFMLVYDVGSRQSFDAMWGFYRLIVETKWARPNDIPIMMLGNMVDNVSSKASGDKRLRQVTRDMGQSFADLLKLPFTETTIMAPQSVAHCFRQLI